MCCTHLYREGSAFGQALYTLDQILSCESIKLSFDTSTFSLNYRYLGMKDFLCWVVPNFLHHESGIECPGEEIRNCLTQLHVQSKAGCVHEIWTLFSQIEPNQWHKYYFSVSLSISFNTFPSICSYKFKLTI